LGWIGILDDGYATDEDEYDDDDGGDADKT